MGLKETSETMLFNDLTENLKQTMDEAYFAMLGIEQGLATFWGPASDERMTKVEANQSIRDWHEVIDDLDSAAHELRKLQIMYYQKVNYPELEPETPESIIKHGRLIVTFAIHRALWVLRAYETVDADMLAMLRPDRVGELTFQTIAQKIGHSAAAVAHWHKVNPLPKSATVIHKLVDFYGLAGTEDALYWVTPKGGIFIPYRMIMHYRG